MTNGRRLALLATLMLTAPTPGTAQERLDSTQRARLVALGRLWNAVKYFHPAIVERPLDWDGALTSVVPKVLSARSTDEYAAAVAAMLAPLADPATRVVPSIPPAASSGAGTIPWQFESDSVLVVTMTTAAAVTDFSSALTALQPIAAATARARHVVFDLRLTEDLAPGAGAVLGYVFGSSGLDRALAVGGEAGPGQRTRIHSGLAPRFGGTSGGYASGFRVAEGPRYPEGGARQEQRVVFLVNRRSPIPKIALALQASGRGLIIAEGGIDDAALITTERIALTDGVNVDLRTSELIWPDGTTGTAPDSVTSVAEAMVVALSAARSGLPARTARRHKPPAVASAPVDEAYQAMAFPTLPYRLLAGFRIWGVFRYFFPYREYQQEDWTAVFDRSLGELAAARDSTGYALAVAEMVTHVHDSHAFVTSPALQAHFGLFAPQGIRVRLIGGTAVIVDVVDSTLRGRVRVGDVIASVDGEPVRARIDRIGKSIAASTPQARSARVGDLLLNGAQGSPATIVISGTDPTPRTISLPRTRHIYYQQLPPARGDRPVTRILPGNIGYADLARLPVGSVDSMFTAFATTRGIIFDMRGYPLGTAWAIAPRLADRPAFAAACFWRLEAESPNEYAELRGTFAQRLDAVGPRYAGPTVMLIDERAISQAEHTGLLLRAANGTVFVGSPTQGANGDVTNFVVPGRIIISLSGQGVKAVDGTQLQRRGLMPDVPAAPTLAGIRGNRDEILDRAVRFLQSGGKLVSPTTGKC